MYGGGFYDFTATPESGFFIPTENPAINSLTALSLNADIFAPLAVLALGSLLLMDRVVIPAWNRYSFNLSKIEKTLEELEKEGVTLEHVKADFDSALNLTELYHRQKLCAADKEFLDCLVDLSSTVPKQLKKREATRALYEFCQRSGILVNREKTLSKVFVDEILGEDQEALDKLLVDLISEDDIFERLKFLKKDAQFVKNLRGQLEALKVSDKTLKEYEKLEREFREQILYRNRIHQYFENKELRVDLRNSIDPRIEAALREAYVEKAGIENELEEVGETYALKQQLEKINREITELELIRAGKGGQGLDQVFIDFLNLIQTPPRGASEENAEKVFGLGEEGALFLGTLQQTGDIKEARKVTIELLKSRGKLGKNLNPWLREIMIFAKKRPEFVEFLQKNPKVTFFCPVELGSSRLQETYLDILAFLGLHAKKEGPDLKGLESVGIHQITIDFTKKEPSYWNSIQRKPLELFKSRVLAGAANLFRSKKIPLVALTEALKGYGDLSREERKILVEEGRKNPEVVAAFFRKPVESLKMVQKLKDLQKAGSLGLSRTFDKIKERKQKEFEAAGKKFTKKDLEAAAHSDPEWLQEIQWAEENYPDLKDYKPSGRATILRKVVTEITKNHYEELPPSLKAFTRQRLCYLNSDTREFSRALARLLVFAKVKGYKEVSKELFESLDLDEFFLVKEAYLMATDEPPELGIDDALEFLGVPRDKEKRAEYLKSLSKNIELATEVEALKGSLALSLSTGKAKEKIREDLEEPQEIAIEKAFSFFFTDLRDRLYAGENGSLETNLINESLAGTGTLLIEESSEEILKDLKLIDIESLIERGLVVSQMNYTRSKTLREQLEKTVGKEPLEKLLSKASGLDGDQAFEVFVENLKALKDAPESPETLAYLTLRLREAESLEKEKAALGELVGKENLDGLIESFEYDRNHPEKSKEAVRKRAELFFKAFPERLDKTDFDSLVDRLWNVALKESRPNGEEVDEKANYLKALYESPWIESFLGRISNGLEKTSKEWDFPSDNYEVLHLLRAQVFLYGRGKEAEKLLDDIDRSLAGERIAFGDLLDRFVKQSRGIIATRAQKVGSNAALSDYVASFFDSSLLSLSASENPAGKYSEAFAKKKFFDFLRNDKQRELLFDGLEKPVELFRKIDSLQLTRKELKAFHYCVREEFDDPFELFEAAKNPDEELLSRLRSRFSSDGDTLLEKLADLDLSSDELNVLFYRSREAFDKALKKSYLSEEVYRCQDEIGRGLVEEAITSVEFPEIMSAFSEIGQGNVTQGTLNHILAELSLTKKEGTSFFEKHPNLSKACSRAAKELYQELHKFSKSLSFTGGTPFIDLSPKGESFLKKPGRGVLSRDFAKTAETAIKDEKARAALYSIVRTTENFLRDFGDPANSESLASIFDDKNFVKKVVETASSSSLEELDSKIEELFLEGANDSLAFTEEEKEIIQQRFRHFTPRKTLEELKEFEESFGDKDISYATVTALLDKFGCIENIDNKRALEEKDYLDNFDFSIASKAAEVFKRNPVIAHHLAEGTVLSTRDTDLAEISSLVQDLVRRKFKDSSLFASAEEKEAAIASFRSKMSRAFYSKHCATTRIYGKSFYEGAKSEFSSEHDILTVADVALHDPLAAPKLERGLQEYARVVKKYLTEKDKIEEVFQSNSDLKGMTEKKTKALEKLNEALLQELSTTKIPEAFVVKGIPFGDISLMELHEAATVLMNREVSSVKKQFEEILYETIECNSDALEHYDQADLRRLLSDLRVKGIDLSDNFHREILVQTAHRLHRGAKPADLLSSREEDIALAFLEYVQSTWGEEVLTPMSFTKEMLDDTKGRAAGFLRRTMKAGEDLSSVQVTAALEPVANYLKAYKPGKDLKKDPVLQMYEHDAITTCAGHEVANLGLLPQRKNTSRKQEVDHLSRHLRKMEKPAPRTR